MKKILFLFALVTLGVTGCSSTDNDYPNTNRTYQQGQQPNQYQNPNGGMGTGAGSGTSTGSGNQPQ